MLGDRKKSQPAGSVETQSHEWATISSEFNQFRSIPSAPSMTAGVGGLSKIEYQSIQRQTISEESYLINNSNEEEKTVSCKERMKRWLSNEVNWKLMQERNIIFNCAEEADSNGDELEKSLLLFPESQKKSQKIKKSQQQQQQFRSNAICTSKYTILNFFFLNLYEQFTKLANIYFLAMGLFQMIPAISSSEGIPYVYLPLSFIIVVTAIKDIVEDIKRHRSDAKENNYPAERYSKNQFAKVRSADIQVGDIIKVSQNHQIPADIVLLFSSTQIAGNSNQARRKGVCYLETKNLDGETSLKSKTVHKGVQQLIQSEESLADFEGTLKSEAPNPFLYKYSGSLRLFRKDKTDENFLRVHCEEENFLLRGSILKNTEFVIGVVTFTGHESKIMLNSNRPRPKKSKVELDMNRKIILIWLSQAIFCLISASFGLLWFALNKDSLSYLELENDGVSQNYFGYFWVRYGNWLLIFMNFVPISLLITLDVIRICQALVIMKSKKMISFHLIGQNDDVNGLAKEDIVSQREKDRLSAAEEQPLKKEEEHELSSPKMPSQDQIYTRIRPIVQSSNLNEDLGQIKCVFSDKTGTLTCNVMNLKAVIFKGRIYGELQNDYMNSPSESQPEFGTFQRRLQNECRNKSKQEREEEDSKTENVNFNDIEFTEMVQTNSDPDLQKFLEHLAICHTVLYSESPSGGGGGCYYQATSPDELALVAFSKFFGVEFKGHTEQETIKIISRNSVNAENNQSEFSMLHILHFSSERKRMSVIVKDSLGRIALLTKGADQVILPRITSITLNSQETANQNITNKLESISQNLSTLSKNGLRTLVMAHKLLDLDYYMEWKRRYEDAQNLLGGNKENEMNALMEEIEQGLEFLGATGIEDKLQPDVEDTIVALKSAGVTVWILTGDKRETAINVALCSKIVQSEKIIEIYSTEISELVEQLRQIGIDNQRVVETVTAYHQQIPEDQMNEDAFMSSVSSDENIAGRIQDMSMLSNAQRCRDQMQSNNRLITSNKCSNDSCSIMDQNALEFYLSCQAYSLVIEGYSLELLMNSNKQTQQLFQEAIKKASSIVACRVSPKQKQLLVSMYKRFFPKHRTLAIGDGANDVNMLTEAHVGVGIQGLEGLQAARASDFSIGEFKLLKRLLLVHGRECYRRNSTVILFNFYKNIVYLVPVFWFGIYSGFSGTFIYDQLLYQCFNTFFTSVPIILFAVLDKDLSSKVLMSVPYFYRLGVQNRHFNASMLWQWFFNAVFQSFVIGTICIFVLQSATIDAHEPGVDSTGQTMFGVAVIVVNVKVLIFSNVQYLITIIICILSTLLYMGMAAFFNIIHNNELYLEYSKLIEQPTAWLALLLILALTALFDIGHRTYMKVCNLQQIKKALNLNEDEYSILVESTIEQENQQNKAIINKEKC